MRGSLPRRYAKALIEIAKEENQVERIGQELENLTVLFKKSPDLLETLANDSFDTEERLSAVREIADRFGFYPMLKNFLLLLIGKKRIDLFPEIEREYRRFQDEILGIVRVRVTGPKPPEKSVLDGIEKLLSRKLQKKVISEGKVQPEIIGGLVLEIDHTVYDGSIRRELERMKEMMLNG